MDGGEANDVSLQLCPCRVCGRTFLPTALERHEKICKNTGTKKRKVFDSFKQRAKEIGLQPVKLPEKEKDKQPKEKPKWKEKHEEFIKTIRAAKGVEDREEEHTTRSPKQKYIPSDYVTCPHCGRNFNNRAADRHISWCQEQKCRIPKSPASTVAMERLKARTKYRAPLPKKRDSFEDDKRSIISTSSGSKLGFNTLPYSSPASLGSVRGTKLGVTTISSNGGSSREMNTRKYQSFGRRSVTDQDLKRLQEDNFEQNYGSLKQSVKFKDKFPNRGHRLEKGDAYDPYKQAELQFNDLVKATQLKSHAPRTVPGVRTSSLSHSSNHSDGNRYWTGGSHSSNNNQADDEMNSLQMKFADMGNANGYSGDFTSSWSKKLYSVDQYGLPEVSSSDSPPFCSRDQWTSDGDARLSTSSSSDSSLPPVSRGSSSNSRLPRFCYHCGTKYPLFTAKYCCECGARRVAHNV